MNCKFPAFFVLLIVVSNSQHASGISKCVDRNGKTTYQTEPCPVNQTSRPVSIPNPKESAQNLFDTPSTVSSTLVKLPAVGQIGVMTYGSWQVSQTSGTAPTIRLQNKKINQPMSITLTFLPNKSSQALSEQQQIETVKNIATQYVDSSIEQKTSLRRLITPIGDALLANFNDAKFQNSPAPQGQYSSVTTGLISHKEFSVSITILTNGVKTSAHADALDVLASLLLIRPADLHLD